MVLLVDAEVEVAVVDLLVRTVGKNSGQGERDVEPGEPSIVKEARTPCMFEVKRRHPCVGFGLVGVRRDVSL